jgi:hypothetical protein
MFLTCILLFPYPFPGMVFSPALQLVSWYLHYNFIFGYPSAIVRLKPVNSHTICILKKFSKKFS